jgi:5-amino-6-(5-phosphoribosylamino)uracil reductase
VDRPYLLLSCAMSLDGYIDDASSTRLLLSSEADFDRVDELRAGCDAILVGAGTVRADDPRLVVRSPARRAARIARGAPSDPVKVVLSGSGDIDPAARIFNAGQADALVYVGSAAAARARARLGAVTEVVDAGDQIDLTRILADLAARGIGRLMVEGGASVQAQFLSAGLADELQLAIAPFFLADAAGPRFASSAAWADAGPGPRGFPWNSRHRARLAEVGQAGDMAVLRYALSGRYPGQSVTI